MLMVKSIRSQIQPNDWVVTIDLNDAYLPYSDHKETQEVP